ncbi:MAG TPA: hypothetical protein VH370_05775 [Humisphaera sp.]|jgi:tetratricopeptide (TPR) repeat protein|nr:hypothetical protein [Humisphaera sp.]
MHAGKRAILGFAILLMTGARLARADDLSSLIQQLDDPDPRIRSEATEHLSEARDAAATALRAALLSDSPELASRARRLLAPAAPPPLPRLSEPQPLVAFRGANDADRRRLIVNQIGSSGASMLARFWSIERRPELRQQILAGMEPYPSAAVAGLLGEGNSTLADLLLEMGMNDGVRGAAEAYAAVALCRGRVDDAIARWSGRGQGDPPDPTAQRTLALLYRAKADWPNALAGARLAEDPPLLESTLLAAGNWAALADAIRRRPVPPRSVYEFGLLSACDYMAGDAAAFGGDVRDMLGRINTPNETFLAANVLLMCDRADDALLLLTNQRQWSAAFEVLAARGKIEEASKLLADRDADNDAEGMFLRIAAGRMFHRLGLRQRASELFARVASQSDATKLPAVFFALAQTERECGRPDEAWEHFATAFAAVPARSVLLRQLSSVFVDREDDIDWAALWQLMDESNPPEHRRKSFATLRSIYDRTISVSDLRDLSHWNGHGPLQAATRVELALELARRTADSGDARRAAEMIATLIENSSDTRMLLHLGDLAATHSEWPRAAQFYNAAWDADRAEPLPMYLLANALAQTGEFASSGAAANLARSLSVADPAQRFDTVRQLQSRGVDWPIAGEAEVLRRTAPPTSLGGDFATRFAAEQPKRRGDATAERALLQEMIVHLGSGTIRMREQAGYPMLSYHLHTAQAREALAAGDEAAMLVQMQRCRDLAPDEISLAVDLIPDLDKRGRRAEAEELFKSTFAIQRQMCERYPDSPLHHNQLAWLGAECNRELDLALEHAKRAVELEPTRTTYIDTLAEVYFQRRQFDEAIEQMNRCIQLEPKVRRHREQLEKFIQAKAG